MDIHPKKNGKTIGICIFHLFIVCMHISANIQYIYIYIYVYVLAFLKMCGSFNMFLYIWKLFACSTNIPLSTQVDGYSSQRLAHVAAFGPVNLTLEDPPKTDGISGAFKMMKSLSCGALKTT